MVAYVDTSSLDSAQATSLEQLVNDALAEAPAEPADSRVRDGQQYEVVITRDGDTQVLRASDPVTRPALNALLAELGHRAKPKR
jgi:hypothetical protein